MLGGIRQILLPSRPGAFRLWLALVVVLHHITRIEIGRAPVMVFFVLSGFWVHRVWFSRYIHTRQPWLTFAISRWWRIAPVLLLATPLALVLTAALPDPRLGPARAALADMPLRHLFSTVTALGYAELPLRPVGPAWSLDVEMQFYLVAPLLVLLVLLVRGRSMVLSLTVGYALFAAGIMLVPGVNLLSFLQFFVIGMVAAEHRWSPPPRLAEAALAVAILLVVAIMVSPWSWLLMPDGSQHWLIVNLLLVALALPQALVSVTTPAAPETRARDAVWADQSYIVYMLHWPAILVYRNVPWPDTAAQIAGGLGLAVLVGLGAWAVHRWIDRPLNRVRARWVAGRAVLPAQAAKEGDSASVLA